MRVPFQKFIDKLKRSWMKIVLRGVRYSNNFKQIDRLYLLSNPWQLNSQYEDFRFKEINRLILENFGQVGPLLEIGCGEGHQSLYLKDVCDKLIGLDISARAIKRARRRCPGNVFLVGDIFSQNFETRSFDLVVACEVLYYMNNIQMVLRRMRELSHKCLVTYFYREMATLDPLILSIPDCTSEIIEFKETRWRVAWWRNR